MKRDDGSYWGAGWLPVVVCWVAGCFLGLFGLLMALVQLLMMANMQSGRWEHLAIFVAGWSLVIGCWMGVGVLVRRPSWKRLWMVMAGCGILFGVDWCLNMLPAARHLLH